MKSLICFLLIIINCADLSAQFSFYASVGANYSKFNSILFGKEYYDEYNPDLKYHIFPNAGLEIRFKKDHFEYITGLYWSFRGGRDYSDGARVFNHIKYYLDINSYIELPLALSYDFNTKYFNAGIGCSPHLRTLVGTVYQYEVGKYWGWDLKFFTSLKLPKGFELTPSYTLGNFDKYLKNTYGVFMHHVFSLQVKYRLF